MGIEPRTSNLDISVTMTAQIHHHLKSYQVQLNMFSKVKINNKIQASAIKILV